MCIHIHMYNNYKNYISNLSREDLETCDFKSNNIYN